MLLSEEGWSDSGKANQQISTGLEAFTHHGGEQEHVTVAQACLLFWSGLIPLFIPDQIAGSGLRVLS